MKRILIGIMIFCCFVGTMAQPMEITPVTPDIDNFKRGLSPQVALMNQYGDYPVDLQNGLVDISIPLYTVQTPGLTMPLQLKFHASGLRVDDREGLLGIRWALAGGGHVSRIIKGYADDFYPFNNNVNNKNYTPNFYDLFGTTGNKREPGDYVSSNNSEFTSSWWYTINSNAPLTQYTKGDYKDTEYDIFSYSLPSGKSGKFILKDDNGTETACLMPYEPVKVYMNRANISTGRFTSVIIDDENGIRYSFRGYTDSDANNWTTTWHLSSIISANKKDTIQIDYTRLTSDLVTQDRSLVISDRLVDNTELYSYENDIDPHGSFTGPSSLYLLIGDLITGANTGRANYFDQRNFPIVVSNNDPYYIHSIQFKSGGRLIGLVNFDYGNDRRKFLQEMTIKNGQGNLIKKIGFVLKNNQSNKFKLLDKIEFVNILSPTKKEIYSFDYYDSGVAPACADLALNSDWWGFYSQSGGYLQQVDNYPIALSDKEGGGFWYFYPKRTIQGGDKKSNVESMKVGMIRQINYPTGGHTEFRYEANGYNSGRPSDPVYGGLRIQKIINVPESGKTEIKEYKYGKGSLPIYFSPLGPGQNIYTEIEIDCYAPAYYDQYGKFHGIGMGRYMQRTFQNSFPSQYTDFCSNTVAYQEVSEYIGEESGKNIGKTVYRYNVSPLGFNYFLALNNDEFSGNGRNFRYGHVSPKNYWRGNNLASKTVYEGDRKVKRYEYQYNHYDKESVYDLPVYRYRHHLIGSVSWDGSFSNKHTRDKQEIFMLHPDMGCINCLEHSFAFIRQEYTSGAEKLEKEIEYTFYSDRDSLVVVKEYNYEPEHFLLSEEKITNSDGKVTVTQYKYPFNSSGTPFHEKGDRNILTPIVNKRTIVNDIEMENARTYYFDWDEYGWPYPRSITDHLTKREIEYSNYTSLGQPISVKKDGGSYTTYLWSYSGQYPIAEIVGVDYHSVRAALNYTETQMQNLFTSINPDINTIGHALRTNLPQAQVTTYTYNPLIGRTSQTDPGGVTTYYQYDGFGRLQSIKDKDGYIIEEYEYHYKNN